MGQNRVVPCGQARNERADWKSLRRTGSAVPLRSSASDAYVMITRGVVRTRLASESQGSGQSGAPASERGSAQGPEAAGPLSRGAVLWSGAGPVSWPCSARAGASASPSGKYRCESPATAQGRSCSDKSTDAANDPICARLLLFSAVQATAQRGPGGQESRRCWSRCQSRFLERPSGWPQ